MNRNELAEEVKILATGLLLTNNENVQKLFSVIDQLRDAEPASAQGEPVIARIDSRPILQSDGLYRAEVTLTAHLPQFTDLYSAAQPEPAKLAERVEWAKDLTADGHIPER